MNAIEKILHRGVEEIIVKNHLEKALRSGKKLRVKLGIDPTAPDLHLGHTVVLRKLRQFQDAGHKAVLIIGDFTAQIGDPSARAEARKPLTPKEIKINLKSYLKQAGKVINVQKAEIRYNSEWHKKTDLQRVSELLSDFTVQQIIARDDFSKRLREHRPLWVHEILYPALQAYDSVMVRADVELGGTDQKFNLLAGRSLMEKRNLKPQDVLTVPLIEGLDGVRKMSKSFKNYIGLNENPNEMFAKIMAVPDKLIPKYFELLTDENPPRGTSPYQAKITLSETIVAMYHSKKEATAAKNEFSRVFSKKELPAKIPSLKLQSKKTLLTELLIKSGVPSKSEARRLITQGAVELNGEKKTNPQERLNLSRGDVLKIGKHRFFRIQ